MKKTIVLVAMFCFPAVSVAQVSCSAGVKPEVCKEVASAFNIPSKGMAAAAKKPIPVEVVTPKEYKERIAAMHKAEDDGEIRCAMKRMHKDTSCFSNQEPHALYNPLADDITFLRDTTANALPDRVLISSDAFDGLALSVDNDRVAAEPNGHFDPEMLFAKVNYILGYVVGCYSQQRVSQSPLFS